MRLTNDADVRAASARLRRHKGGEWWEEIWPGGDALPTRQGDLHTLADAMLSWEDAVLKGEASPASPLSYEELEAEMLNRCVEPQHRVPAGTPASLSLAEIKRVVKALFEDQASLFWHMSDAGRLSVSVDSSGLFSDHVYGADYEEITPANLPLLEATAAEEESVGAMLDYGIDAPTLFCCRVRNRRPHARHYDGLNPAAVALLNACGPERLEATRE